MWKSLNPGENVSLGDIIRYISSQAVSAFGEKLYQVVRTELHYFEIAPRQEFQDHPAPGSDRKIIKYTDVGYHLGLEVWLDQLGQAM